MPHLRLALLSLLAGFVLPPAASAAAPEGPRLAFPLACAIVANLRGAEQCGSRPRPGLEGLSMRLAHL
jgi:hypothetical protein